MLLVCQNDETSQEYQITSIQQTKVANPMKSAVSSGCSLGMFGSASALHHSTGAQSLQGRAQSLEVSLEEISLALSVEQGS